MERFEEIYAAGLEIMSEQYAQNLADIKKKIDMDIDAIDQEFLEICDKLFVNCIEQQEKLQKDPVKYIDIAHLASSRITGTHDFGIFLYSALCYLDLTDTSVLWHPDFIYSYLDADRELFTKRIKQKFVRVRDHEIEEFMERYTSAYDSVAVAYFLHAAPLMLNLSSFSALTKAEGFKIRLGKYMEQMKVIA